MSIGAVNNATAFNVYTNYTQANSAMKENMSNLSEGRKGVEQDPAGVSISERMQLTIGGTNMARQNLENGISVMQTADSWMQKMNDILTRMNELAVEAVDDTKGSQDRANLQTEFGELQEELDRIVSTASFNQQNLLDGTLSSAVLQIGAEQGQTMNIGIQDMNGVVSSVTASGTTISTVSQASAAIGHILTAVDDVSEQRAELGGQMSRMESTISGLMTNENNIRAAESKIRDIDMAREASEKAQNQALNQVGNAMLAQANQLPSQVVQLLR